MNHLRINNLNLMMNERCLLKSCNMTVNAGEVWGILGNNGVGKTTFLHALANINKSYVGEIFLNNALICSYPKRLLAQKVGLLLQQQADPFPTTVLETVMAGRHPYLARFSFETIADMAIAKQALSDFDLIGLEQRVTSELSGGERRRVALARLATQQPNIYLLDEPINHLDPKHQLRTLRYFSEKAKKDCAIVFIALHDLNLAERFCNHSLLLYGNGDYDAGPKQDMLCAEKLARVYQQNVHYVNVQQTRIWHFTD